MTLLEHFYKSLSVLEGKYINIDDVLRNFVAVYIICCQWKVWIYR